MNKRQVIVLWIIALLLSAAVIVIRITGKTSAAGSTDRKPGQTLFASFPAQEISRIRIDGGASLVTLEKRDHKWVVGERDGYPANGTYANEFLRTLNQLEVTRGIEAGPSFAARFGMDESAKAEEEHGLTATFFDASGKELAKVTLGKNINSGAQDEQALMMGGGGSVGRYIRNHADESGFYASAELFSSISADPARWLSMDFINLEKVKSISVSEEGKADKAWKVSRESADVSQFKLENAKPEEVLNTTEAQPLNELFSYARFDDVLSAAEVEAKVDQSKQRTVTIETFEGFVYTITLAPAKSPAAEKEGEASPAAPADVLYARINVKAEIAQERKKEANEKPEEAKAKDDEFARRKQQLEEKLAKEKALAGRTYVIARSTAAVLLKSRAELTAKPAPTPGAGTPASAQQFPGGAVIHPAMPPGGGLTTPPVEVPEEEE